MEKLKRKLIATSIIPIITTSEYTEIVRCSRKISKVLIVQYFLSFFYAFFTHMTKNMKAKYGLFSPLSFLSIFSSFIFLTTNNNSKGKF